MGKSVFAGAVALITLGALFCNTANASGAAPRIGGTPPAGVTIGSLYSFTPTATDPEGDTLTFSIASRPSWASFNRSTGRLYGRPATADAGVHEQIVIRASDGTSTRALPQFEITVKPTAASTTTSTVTRKANYGHYFGTRYDDTPADVAMLCGQAGVKGVLWRRTWNEVEPRPGVYDFSDYDDALRAIAGSHNPRCQLWIFIEFKSFNNSPYRNPCPVYLQAKYSALSADGSRAASCFMWEPVVKNAYIAMMKAAAARYDANPRVEGFVIQESALGFNGEYSQDVSAGGTYTARAWRDALVDMVGQCGAAFKQSRCLTFLNFLKGGQEYLNDISAAIARIPNNRGCMSGPDLLPDSTSLYDGKNSVYEVLVRHRGCRSNSAQNFSYNIRGFGLGSVYNFAVGGTFGDFDERVPRTSGVCVNSYLFWNHRVGASKTGLDWTDALPVIAAYPYGRMWLDQCAGGGAAP